jgi:phosphoglycolate phosphatase
MTGSEYDVWLFDLDGTVVDTEFEHAQWVFDRVGDRIGETFSDRQVRLLWHGIGGERDETLRAWDVDPKPFWRAFHDIEDPQRRAEATFLYDDAEPLLESLDGPVGLVTHSQPHLTEPVLDRLGIGDWFDTVVCCSEELGWKPDPTPVERALADLGATNGHSGVFVGDSPGDVGAAWNAGLDAVHVERFDPDWRGHCVRADRRIERLDELA